MAAIAAGAASYCGLSMVRSCCMNMLSYCAVQACCMAGKGACKGVTHSSRAAYGLMLAFTSVLSMLLRIDYFSELIAKIPAMGGLGKFDGITLPELPAEAIGNIGVMRVGLAVAVFHAIMSVCLFGVETSKDRRAACQTGSWCMKFVLWAGLIVLSFFLPVSMFGSDWYSFQWVAFVGADLFIFVQLILLIAFAHKMNDSVVERWDQAEGNSKCGWAAVLLIVTFGLYAVALAGAAFMFAEFSDLDGCSVNIAVVSVTLILCMLVTMASITPRVRAAQGGSSGLFQSAIMVSYSLYLVGSGVLSTPVGHCAPFAGSVAATGSAKVAGLFCTFLAVLYSTIRNGSAGGPASSINQGLLADLEAAEEDMAAAADGEDVPTSPKEGGDSKGGDEGEDGQADAPTAYSYSFFHATFCLASMYICMLLTSWGSVEGVEKELAVNNSMTSVWTKFVTAWLCLLLFGWTLIAPILLPDRVFNYE